MRISNLTDGVVSPTEAVMAALLAQAGKRSAWPLLLAYAPVAEMNPFQRLLYCRASDEGFALVPVASGLDHLAPMSWARRSVIHLHWLASILEGAASMESALSRISAFRSNLMSMRAAGHRIVWTMHNVLPHDCKLPDAEVALRTVMVEQADAVHLLSRSSADVARKYYELPSEKTFHIPHPSYEGWYANVRDRMTARMDLGLEANEFVFISFGSLQRYKNLVGLIDAFSDLQERNPERRIRLIIAGKAVDKDYLDELTVKVQQVPGVRLTPSAMEERQIQTLFNGADASVAPYRHTLNSGVALLSATFRCPLVAPRLGGIAETFAADSALLYSGESGDALTDAMGRAMTKRLPESVFEEILQTHQPERVSRAFFAELRNRWFADGKRGNKK